MQPRANLRTGNLESQVGQSTAGALGFKQLEHCCKVSTSGDASQKLGVDRCVLGVNNNWSNMRASTNWSIYGHQQREQGQGHRTTGANVASTAEVDAPNPLK
jgi:hypothetical protein